ncbi:FAD-dependent oxidoreductase [Marinomonas sp. 5E14-1]|uniref:flavin monoamine oxidase family protein n=1 Tax=Marinomonas sp. 5E14-1 TaxID=3153922 RepID=UPI0032649675
MNNKKVAIIGGGLSGLYAAYLLEKHGITDYVLLEARTQLGGRINSVAVDPNSNIDTIDLGPTWFWPDFQRQLDHLITELNLTRFTQYDIGNMLIERSQHEAPIATKGFMAYPESVRLSGGMMALINKLKSHLKNQHIMLGKVVRKIQNLDGDITIHYQESQDKNTTKTDSVTVQHVLLALPPRVIENTIEFTPSLPTVLTNQWRNTATWMAAHAKYVAVYDKPFWRDDGLSGSAQSRLGPMVEIHDASMPNGSAALFGFLGVPATVRQQVTHDELKSHCLNQLTRLFGEQATNPKLTVLKDWAQDQYTATQLDFNNINEHGRAPETTANSGSWAGKIIGVGSEWSAQFPGYVAGAIEAASEGVKAYIKQSS